MSETADPQIPAEASDPVLAIPIARPAAPLELTYAPQAKSRSRALWVLASGIFTTVLALVGVYALDIKGETNVMGWYGNYVLPVGALLVGLVASSGYAFSSWKLGVKIRKSLLWTILALMIVAYFAAEYVEYRVIVAAYPTVPTPVRIKTTGGATKVVMIQRPGFWRFFHKRAINWTWKKQYSSDTGGEPLGLPGYFFKFLGLAGFAGGGLIIPGILGAHPYCDLCERYMHIRTLAILPAGAAARKVSKKDAAALAELRKEDQAALDLASQRITRVTEYARDGDLPNFRVEVAQDSAARKAAAKFPRRIEVKLVSCPSCAGGWLESTLQIGQGKQMQQKKLGKIELSQEFVRDLIAT